ncbi:telomerase RNA component interacting RNase-like isoform X3 [Girardinichthys multiradiatus]|uniref:telomerase RNA component interacting RNase-like isoform X3 n=1 Tax=Girardinichthys multiradiatus TaxID=208333 RepID=UPI001FAD54FA|nr:telomerase RNA component interacting RNase-like isoform X3 [Girardinichthys multiradiatus]XP_047214688.1 telomerase RNA component interacting RNase-like isoform X3 [Girardinichthys multiradiatus]
MKVTPRDMDPKRAPGKHKTGGGSSSEDSNPASPSSSPAAAAPAVANVFANDGSFMEIFKKKMEEEKSKKEAQLTVSFIGNPPARTPVTVSVFYPLTQVGKRRGGVFLKTGVVAKKQKQDAEAEAGKSDAWSKYMAEVKKYKAHQCSDDDKTRPLVK